LRCFERFLSLPNGRSSHLVEERRNAPVLLTLVLAATATARLEERLSTFIAVRRVYRRIAVEANRFVVDLLTMDVISRHQFTVRANSG
jgi:hypothetical protein